MLIGTTFDFLKRPRMPNKTESETILKLFQSCFDHIRHGKYCLDQWTMAQRLDKVVDYSSSEERLHTTLSELQNDQPDLSPFQGHATSNPQQVSKPDLGRGTSRFQITQEYHGTDIHLGAIGGKALGTSEGVLSLFKQAILGISLMVLSSSS